MEKKNGASLWLSLALHQSPLFSGAILSEAEPLDLSDQPVHLELSYKLIEQPIASGDLIHPGVALYFCKAQRSSAGKQKANNKTKKLAIRRQQMVRQMYSAADIVSNMKQRRPYSSSGSKSELQDR